jgi:hypothetical protein
MTTSATAPAVGFPFRPWVRRAGLSIVVVAAAATIFVFVALTASSTARYGWFGEHAVWVYIATLWIGGLKVFLGTRRNVAEIGDAFLVLRPLHMLRARAIRWEAISGTEQLIGGDRLIVYHDSRRGMRFMALNLNLVKGRREFLALLEDRLRARGFEEKIVERSRYLSRPR